MTYSTKDHLSFQGPLAHIENSIFSKMSQLAREHQAVNLSQGFPDFEVDPNLIELAKESFEGLNNQYAPMGGVLEFRQTLGQISVEEFESTYDPESEITITAGATQAIASTLACCLREGDEVILFTPAYDCYAPLIELHGATPISIALEPPHYPVDWDLVKRLVNHRTRMVIVNTPHNPTGTVWREKDYKKLIEIVKGSSILVLSDEVYEHIVFDAHNKRSVRQYSELKKRSFIIGSLGKTVHVTGWKMGYCMAPKSLMEQFRKVHQFQVFAVNHPLQVAMAKYLKQIKVRRLGDFYLQKRDYLQQQLEEKTGFKVLPSNGSYFLLVDYSALSEEEDLKFAHRLVEEYRVATIPLSPFYSHPPKSKILRLCFAKNKETIDQAVANLARVKPNF